MLGYLCLFVFTQKHKYILFFNIYIMLHIIGQMRNMFMAGLMSYQVANGPESSPALADASLDSQDIETLLTMDIPEVQEALLKKSQDELQLTAEIATTMSDVTPDSAANNPTMEKQKVIQFIVALHQKLTGAPALLIDGRIGSGTKESIKAILPTYTGGIITQNDILQLVSSTNALLDQRKSALNSSLRPKARPDTVTATPDASVDIAPTTLEEAQKAMELLQKEEGRGGVKKVQEALTAAGLDTKGIDGKIGPATKAAIEARPDIVLATLATYIDEKDNATIAERVKKEAPVDAAKIDVALATLTDTSTPEEIIALANKYTSKELGADIRNQNAQYIALKLQNMGLENSVVAQFLMEKVMAEGKGHYEQETTQLQLRQALVDGSGRFAKGLGRFPENMSGSYYKIRNTLQGASGRARLEAGMTESGISGTAQDILTQTFGVGAEYLATRMHVVTGQAKDGDADMSLELAGGIQLSNAYYDKESGAIYAVVAKGNGCEGNLVVIPVDTFKEPLPPKPKVLKKPSTKPEEPTPEEPEGKLRKRCDWTTHTWILTYPDGTEVDTGTPCGDGGGDNDKPDGQLWSGPTEHDTGAVEGGGQWEAENDGDEGGGTTGGGFSPGN